MVFGGVLTSYLVAELQSADNDLVLRRIFALLEDAIQQGNEDVYELVRVAIELIGDESLDLLSAAREYMGKRLRRLTHEILVLDAFEPPEQDDPTEIVDYYRLSDRLVSVVPELRERYEQLRQEWGPGDQRPGQHVVFGSVLAPYMVTQLRLADNDELLRRIFALLEEIATHESRYVREVVQVTVCEYLIGHHAELIEVAQSYMGVQTSRLCQEIAYDPGHTYPSAER